LWDQRRGQQGGRSASRAARGDGRLRRDRLCRHGLGRPGARQAFDGADGRAGAAARPRGARQICRRLTSPRQLEVSPPEIRPWFETRCFAPLLTMRLALAAWLPTPTLTLGAAPLARFREASQ